MTAALRVALAGKGGAGKTTISSTLARVMGRRGRQVLVIDGDSNPNVAFALGVSRERAAATPTLSHNLAARRLDGPRLVKSVSDVVKEQGVSAPDGVDVVLMAMPAHADEGCLCSAHATVSALLADAGQVDGLLTILDLEASPEHLSRGTARYVDALLLITEPYYRSLETARRMALLAAELPIPYVAVVANKVRSEQDADAIREFCERHDLAWAGQVPWSDSVTDADRASVPLIEWDTEGPVVTAVTAVADHLVGLGPRRAEVSSSLKPA